MQIWNKFVSIVKRIEESDGKSFEIRTSLDDEGNVAFQCVNELHQFRFRTFIKSDQCRMDLDLKRPIGRNFAKKFFLKYNDIFTNFGNFVQSIMLGVCSNPPLISIFVAFKPRIPSKFRSDR